MAKPDLPSIGTIVLWYPLADINTNPCAAVVTHVSMDSVSLSIFEPNRMAMTARDAVRHVSDPRTRMPDLINDGAWEWTQEHRRISKLEELIERLTARMKA